MNKIKFTKMHGLGNDFVIIEEEKNLVKFIPEKMKEFAIEICDRKTGLGCDQLIIFSFAERVKMFKMKIFNPNGTEASACGNATRCLALLLSKTHLLSSSAASGSLSLQIEVSGRILDCNFGKDEDLISVNMGKGHLDKSWMPRKEDVFKYFEKFNFCQNSRILMIDIGNPHLVIFSEKEYPFLDENFIKFASSLEKNTNLFPLGININFAQVVGGRKIKLKVWERGTGYTLCCGSGASATFIAAEKLNLLLKEKDDGERSAEIIFELGSLFMEMNENEEVLMRGPAKFVADGHYIIK